MTATEPYDVIVLGGGTAGVVAAIQAGRAGAKTLLVERTGMLGGTMTNGGVNFPGLFHAWGRQVISGIGWELVSRAVAEAGDTLPDFTDYKRPHWQLHVRVDAFLYAALCDEAAVAAGADILLHAMPAALCKAPEGDGWNVTLCTKTGLSTCRTRIIIDATGDANAASLAGLPVTIPDETQPATLSCLAGGYEPAQLDIEAINRAFDAEVKAGRLAYTDASWNTAAANVGKWLSKHGANASHVHHINARDSAGKTQLELEARKRLLRLYRFLHRQPGLKALRLAHLAPECGVRETAVIRGKRTVTAEDYCSGRQWDDAVCHSFYPLDLHTSAGGGLRCEPLSEGVVPTVPRGALLPEGSRNFLVAGRCLASDRLANSALRVQATCMATGQAAGALAALAARAGIDTEAVPLAELDSVLRHHAAIVPERGAKEGQHL
jgi:hypothetical protein